MSNENQENKNLEAEKVATAKVAKPKAEKEKKVATAKVEKPEAEKPVQPDVAKENSPEVKAQKTDTVELQGLFAVKKGMSSVYDESGKKIPVTVLKYDTLVVSQVKSEEKEGYAAVQVASAERSVASSNKACEGHFKKSGFERGAKWSKEIRQTLPEGVTVGQKVSISSLAKGDTVKMTGRSKGRGFSGVVKRWGFAGGPASHGSRFQRGTGSIGQCTFPGRVMKGRKMPGRYGFDTMTRNTQIVDVLPEQNAILIKGAVPGAVNSLIQLMKV